MPQTVFLDVADVLEGAALVRALERHGLIAGLVHDDERWSVEVSSTCQDPHTFPTALGAALMRCSGAELGIAGATTGEVAWPPDGDATEFVASFGAESRTAEALRLRIRVLLLGAACFELARRREQHHLEAASVAALARQAADIAYTEVLARLGDYHGQSRFTTWAAKFGIHHAAVAARRASGNSREPCHGPGGGSTEIPKAHWPHAP